MQTLPEKNSTNVRFLLLLAASACASCATSLAPSPVATTTCDARSMLVCERFGAQRRCACTQRSALGTLPQAATDAAWLGGVAR